ncbi:MAG TPA: recombinase family protein [Phycisphaerae bacterium]|nr:recombinase family protein [Phycisphaerae bacterium]
MEKKSQTEALAYLRVSGKGQVRGDGFARQRETIRQYAESHWVRLVGEYRDEGISGTRDLADWAGLAALLDRLESNGVNVVLVGRADRLARDLLVGEVILGQFREAGATVIAADSGTDLTAGDNDPTRVLIRQVLGAVSQFEKSVIVLKLRAARERVRARNGRCEGRKPFGTRPGEAQTVERIRQLRRKPKGRPRLSVANIAEILNAEGRPTRTGGPWRPGTVWGILRRLAK